MAFVVFPLAAFDHRNGTTKAMFIPGQFWRRYWPHASDAAEFVVRRLALTVELADFGSLGISVENMRS